ncbi:MAG: ATP-binding protein [Kiritimatiellae bacterium]|nr:ATP-binding protein [Kiritimatiellia bacterium]
MASRNLWRVSLQCHVRKTNGAHLHAQLNPGAPNNLNRRECSFSLQYGEVIRGVLSNHNCGQLLAVAHRVWLRSHENCIITGPTGAGKSYLACAFGNQACRRGFSVCYFRAQRFFQQLAVARGSGRYEPLPRSLLRTDLIIIDDWGTALLADEERRDLFEVIEDRYDRRSTLIAAQVPIEHWHDTIGDPTLADAILDRLIHNAHTITLKGDSMRKRNAT